MVRRYYNKPIQVIFIDIRSSNDEDETVKAICGIAYKDEILYNNKAIKISKIIREYDDALEYYDWLYDLTPIKEMQWTKLDNVIADGHKFLIKE